MFALAALGHVYSQKGVKWKIEDKELKLIERALFADALCALVLAGMCHASSAGFFSREAGKVFRILCANESVLGLLVGSLLLREKAKREAEAHRDGQVAEILNRALDRRLLGKKE